jgi:hypothetical protein
MLAFFGERARAPPYYHSGEITAVTSTEFETRMQKMYQKNPETNINVNLFTFVSDEQARD